MSELEDLKAIERLTYEYAIAVDTFQLDALMDLFLPEAVFDPGPGHPPENFMNNRDEIRAFFQGLFDVSTHLYHAATNHIIDIDGDTATGTVYYLAKGVTTSGGGFGAHGYYADTYARTADGWKFRRRDAAGLLDPDYSNWEMANG